LNIEVLRYASTQGIKKTKIFDFEILMRFLYGTIHPFRFLV